MSTKEDFMSVLEATPAPKGSFKKGVIIGLVIVLVGAFITFVLWKMPDSSLTLKILDERLKVVESKGCLVNVKNADGTTQIQPVLCSQK